MRLLPVIASITALVIAAPAGAVTVAVAPVRDDQAAEGEGLRKQIEHGLADNGVTVVSFSALVQAASAQGFASADLARPAVLMPVAKAAGAEAVLTGSVQREGRGETLDIRVFNLDGVELWSRPIPMKKGKLDKDVPRKIARAVAAAIASGPPASAAAATPDANPDATPTVAAKPDEAKPDEAKPDEAKPEEAKPEEAKPEEAPKPRKPIAATGDDGNSTPSKPVKKPAKKQKDDEDKVDVDGPPVDAKPDTTPAPPYIDLGAGLTITFRSYKVCPGVTSCSQPGPTPTADGKDVPISYNTSTPYGGFNIQGEIFPLPRLVSITDQLTFTLGVGGEFGQSLTLTNAYADPANNGKQSSFNSYEQRAEAAVLARLYYNVLGGTGNSGLFGGFEMHRFLVGANDVITESARIGFGVGVNSELPLAGDYFKATARFTFMPAMNPGVPETTEYGQTGAGSGWDFRGGFTGGYGYVGYSALVAYTSFSDTYTGPGMVTTNGAVASESYLTIYILLHGRF